MQAVLSPFRTDDVLSPTIIPSPTIMPSPTMIPSPIMMPSLSSKPSFRNGVPPPIDVPSLVTIQLPSDTPAVIRLGSIDWVVEVSDIPSASTNPWP